MIEPRHGWDVGLDKTLQAFAASSPVPAFCVDDEGYVRAWGPAAETLLNWSSNEVIGRHVEAIAGAAYATLASALDRVAANGSGADLRLSWVTKGGARVEVSTVLSPLFGEGGQMRGMLVVLADPAARESSLRDGSGQPSGFLGAVRDLSESQKMEEALLRLAAVVESAHDAILSLSPEGIITSWNPGAERLYGYTANEAIGQPLTMLEAAERAGQVAQLVERVRRGETIRHLETVRRRKDGTSIEVSVSLAPIRTSDGAVLGCAITQYDITARRQADRDRLELLAQEKELAATAAAEQEASRMKSEFLANMSHELRTPLNTIIGFAEILHDERAGPLTVPQKEFMRDILASATHLVGIINSVLDLSRIEAGRIELEPVSVNLPAMVGQVLETLTLLAEEKHITLASAVAPEVETIVTDATKLRQVLYNYLSNAIKFTPDGGNVRLTARAESDEMVRIEVLDTGIGIAADDQSRLFQEFQQLDTGMSKRYPGTGLGLALTKRIVEAEGGSVGVASTPGEGSVFHAILPRRLSPKE